MLPYIRGRHGDFSIQHKGHLYTPICLHAPYICMTPIPPIHLYVLPIPYVPYMSWDLGASLHPIWLLDFWGASVQLSGISVSVGTSIAPQFISHTSCSSSLWVASLLDWMSIDVCYASSCCSFLCSVFIMSQASTTKAMRRWMFLILFL